jgi:hypothetical protein
MYTARQLAPGSRAAVLRRSEQTRLSSASDGEVGSSVFVKLLFGRS